LFLEAELSNVDSILADDKAFDTDLEIEGKLEKVKLSSCLD
jgi:hypothetical protein